jgi:hypothetical protein
MRSSLRQHHRSGQSQERQRSLEIHVTSPSSLKKSGTRLLTHHTTSNRFDTIYDDKVKQDVLYNRNIKDVLPKVFDGINSTIFCYGVTGAGKSFVASTIGMDTLNKPWTRSGKTYTMQGCPEDEGVIPRSARFLFDYAQEKYPFCQLHMSYFEIYKENVYDLLKAKDVCLFVTMSMVFISC